ncbi:MAG: UDP-N-acetylmuramoyl-tripeptide--D-alanyl-D-alanine ligase [Bacteroidales bacterium]|nr:UDP-N-acetylmuramoyl-tripeptide--D-alanyl-D-alanine ligase [Bacteroidales bacterium]MBN2749076.1 UDP-N-acetylmuramoyl-tripeptide--D-alanyl-D-alanine ligase [Bacteroidales bacterium]
MNSYLEQLYDIYLEQRAISTDSRNISTGDIFFALKGENFNGNAFALDAIKRGAKLAVVDDIALKGEKGCFYVLDTLEALQQLANYHRKRLQIPVIAITGSNGKTTTKELLACVLQAKFKVFATKGNLNNHIGVPLSILSIADDTELAIIEMGANNLGEIANLASIAEPNYGIITNIGNAHLKGFGSFNGVKQAKGELYDYIAKKGGAVFANMGNPVIAELVSLHGLSGNVITYDTSVFSATAQVSADLPYLNVSITVPQLSEKVTIHTSLVGAYNMENVLAAIRVALYFNVDVALISSALEGYKPSNSRSQLLKTKSNTVIVDAYNANPTSMEAALRNFGKLPCSKKVVILGEMLELGDYSVAEHQRILSIAQDLGCDETILVGEGFREHAVSNNTFFNNVDECFCYLAQRPITGAYILVKGSRGVRLEKVLELL